jgi:poly(U)-binding-splicing factor PUF60
LADIQAKLKTSNDEKGATNGGGTSDAANPNAEVMTTLQQEEDVSISGSNARLMVMQRLSRKNESRVVVLRNMVSMEDVDDDLEEEVASECSRSGKVSNVLIHQEKKGQDEIIIKIFVSFTSPSG